MTIASISLSSISPSSSSPPHPQIVPDFSSPLLYRQTVFLNNSAKSLKSLATFNYSETLFGYLIAATIPLPTGPPGIQYLTSDTLSNRNGTYSFVQEVCRRVSNTTFFPWFVWLKYATYAGTTPCSSSSSSSSGLPATCDVWTLSTPDVSLLLATADGLPFQFTVNQSMPWGLFSIDYRFLDPRAASFPPPFFANPPSCTLPYNAPCPYSPLRPVLPMVRFHQPNQTSLADQNTGDPVGDVLFLCSSILTGSSPELQQVSWYRVQVNYTFGGYSYCNFRVCRGGDPYLVGREAAGGLGLPDAGQCSPNPYGSWYSMPSAGECAAGQSVERGECTWQTISVEKTIALQCLLDGGFTQACIADPTPPYQAAVQVLLKAFATEQPQQGGCPNLLV